MRLNLIMTNKLVKKHVAEDNTKTTIYRRHVAISLLLPQHEHSGQTVYTHKNIKQIQHVMCFFVSNINIGMNIADKG